MTTLPQTDSDLIGLPVRAVDEIGDASASEVEKVATQIEAEAKEKADALRRFATALREQTRRASADLAAFCAKSTDVFTTIKNLETRVNSPESAELVEEIKKLASSPLVRSNGKIEISPAPVVP